MTTLLSGGAEVLLTVGFLCGMGDNGGETCSCLGSTLSCPFTAAGGSWKRTWGEVGRGNKFLGRLSMDMEQTDMISNTTEQ